MLPKEHPEQNSWSRRCLVLGVWVVRKCGKAKGNIYIYIYSYFGMFFEYIHDFEFFIFIFCLVLGVWVLRKCGKAKGNRFFFPKKLEETESWLNRTDWNPVSSMSVFLPYGSMSIPNLVKSKISVWWKNRTSNRPDRTDYTPTY